MLGGINLAMGLFMIYKTYKTSKSRFAFTLLIFTLLTGLWQIYVAYLYVRMRYLQNLPLEKLTLDQLRTFAQLIVLSFEILSLTTIQGWNFTFKYLQVAMSYSGGNGK